MIVVDIAKKAFTCGDKALGIIANNSITDTFVDIGKGLYARLDPGGILQDGRDVWFACTHELRFHMHFYLFKEALHKKETLNKINWLIVEISAAGLEKVSLDKNDRDFFHDMWRHSSNRTYGQPIYPVAPELRDYAAKKFDVFIFC
ncbi:MAG: hypothetical protein WC521_08040 [Bdellovibrionales bacterium]|jgi:hypothetical protein